MQLSVAVYICCGVGIVEAFSCASNLNRRERKFTCLLKMPRLNFRKREQLKIPSSGLVGVFDYKIFPAISI